MSLATRVTLAVALLVRAGAAQAPAARALVVPVYREPHHRLVFENSLVRVLDVRVAPGDTSLYHEHADRYMGVVISHARLWDQPLGGTPSDRDPGEAGTIFDNLKATVPYTHRVWNTGTVPFRYVVALVRRPSNIDAPPLDSTTGVRLERETAIARAYRVTLAPGQATREHHHAQPGLTVQIGDGAVRLEGTPPESASRARGAGAWWWRGAGTSHVLRNVGSAPIDLVEFDWR